jgi:hypothetical protein
MLFPIPHPAIISVTTSTTSHAARSFSANRTADDNFSLRRTSGDGDDLTCISILGLAGSTGGIYVRGRTPGRILPLTQPPSSEARKATTRATSSGVAQRFKGQCSAIMFSILSAAQSGVAPGM